MFGKKPWMLFYAEDEIMNVKPEKGKTQKTISMSKMKSKPAMCLPTLRLFLFCLFFFSFSFSSIIFFFKYSDSVIGNFGCVSPSSDRLTRLPLEQTLDLHYQTNLSHVVFGIAGSSKLWEHRKNYIKQWWRGDVMRGNVWLDVPVNVTEDDVKFFPPVRVSGETSQFNYTHPFGHRSAIRISRIVSESLRLGMENVRWFVMGDDDTFFIADNLIRVLQKYDHTQFYYIGSSSESHIQNLEFSYNMAYGGGGFAISYPLAKELAKMQDRCIQRYPELFGSDDRLHACMAELGVPLTKELGFHQCDIYGNLFGILTAHPITPVVTLHHLDIVDPIFPDLNQTEALQRLSSAIKLDSAGLLQQSICYDRSRTWTISVAWGYAVQIFRGIFTAKELDMPARTFLNWYRESGYKAHAFNSRPFSRNACQKPTLYYFDGAVFEEDGNRTVSEYSQFQTLSPECDWSISDPSQIDRIEVYRKPDPFKWEKSPRRDCCRVLSTEKENTLVINVGPCEEDEVIEF